MIVKEFLLSLSQLLKDGYSVDYHFVTLNETAELNDLLRDFANHNEGRCTIVPSKDEAAQYRTWIVMLSAVKDQMIMQARQREYDYLFLIDNDIILHPKTLEQLVRANKDIISNIFWTNYRGEEEPQVWLSDVYNQFEIEICEKISPEEREKRRHAFFDTLKIPGTYEVGGLGGCTLISKKALAKQISFQPITNISFPGEDRHFCLRAAALDIPLFVDTHYPAYHVIRETGDSSLAALEEMKKTWTSSS
jgi:GT2 family glycosyltransferase